MKILPDAHPARSTSLSSTNWMISPTTSRSLRCMTRDQFVNVALPLEIPGVKGENRGACVSGNARLNCSLGYEAIRNRVGIEKRIKTHAVFPTHWANGRRRMNESYVSYHLRPMQIVFFSRYSSIPYFECSLPSPECFQPPKGATSLVMATWFTPTIPYSSSFATRHVRFTFSV